MKNLLKLDVLDISNYIIDQFEEKQINDLTNTKLQKILFYSFVKYLVDNSANQNNLKTLMDDSFEAWEYGPVCPLVYFKFKDAQYSVLKEHPEGNKNHLFGPEYQKLKQAIDAVINLYGNRTAFDLSKQTHNEDPWLYSFNDLDYLHNKPIDNQHLYNYYSAYPINKD
ncbi:Panacea domain-containing protein [Candidatus Phytoplasma pruni]|uniref:DUF4065 domain-containing protein n=1 Tax=Candidatus Phytoplasma pruni TaxID=479893 RepID=A0A851HKE9_9MOLU|nr:type II toxin-antitoxin system antitoxin SocA domain-containing protein [Candidatus Phytoplasma pruni]NWN45909.1 DUF4065 domain-containing protein [Candidatus Phytoplasma pruni]